MEGAARPRIQWSAGHFPFHDNSCRRDPLDPLHLCNLYHGRVNDDRANVNHHDHDIVAFEEPGAHVTHQVETEVAING